MQGCWELVGEQLNQGEGSLIEVWFHAAGGEGGGGHEGHELTMIGLHAVSTASPGADARAVMSVKDARTVASMLATSLRDANELVPPQHGGTLVAEDLHLIPIGMIHTSYDRTMVALSIHHGHEGDDMDGHQLTFVNIMLWPDGHYQEADFGVHLGLVLGDVRELSATLERALQRAGGETAQ